MEQNEDDYVTRSGNPTITQEEIKEPEPNGEQEQIEEEEKEPEQTEEQKEAARIAAKKAKATKRFEELSARALQAERKQQELEKEIQALKEGKTLPKTLDNGAPDPDSFAAGRYDPDYLDALTDYKVQQIFEQKQKDAIVKERMKAISDMEKKSIEAHDDFEDAKNEFLDHDLSKVPQFMELLSDSDNPAELAYFLGKNPDELDKLGEMTPQQAARYMGRLEARLVNISVEPIKKAVTAASKPITPLGSAKSTTAVKKEEDMTMDEYAAWYKERKKSRSR